MLSSNPYTRRRQLWTIALACSSVALSLGVFVRLARLSPRRTAAAAPLTIPQASFGRVALSPDGTRQVELSEGQIVVRDSTNQKPLAIHRESNIQGVRFTPGGSDILVHVLQKRTVPGQELAQLTDRVVVLDPVTGNKKGEGPYRLTR